MVQSPLIVTAAVIRRGDQVLIAQRKPDSRLEPNNWEFPGGKIEPCEHPEACLKREIKEELGIDIEVQDLLTVVSHVYDKDTIRTHIILLTYWAKLLSGEPKAIDCQNVKWITLSELGNYEFAKADIPITRLLPELGSL